jgi:hypothetical protein
LDEPGEQQAADSVIVGKITLTADKRTNRIHVVTRPVNFPYIKQLIEQLDAPVPLDSVLERQLQFVAAGDVLPVLQDLLSEGEEGETGGGTPRAGAAVFRSASAAAQPPPQRAARARATCRALQGTPAGAHGQRQAPSGSRQGQAVPRRSSKNRAGSDRA